MNEEENYLLVRIVNQSDCWHLFVRLIAFIHSFFSYFNMDDEAETYKLWRIRKTVLQVEIRLIKYKNSIKI
jgi:hypothetical protein